MKMSSEHAQLLFLWAGSTPSTTKRSPGLPNKITNASKGPLSLSGAGETKGVPIPSQHAPSKQPQHSGGRRDTLTRIPVQISMLERPMDVLERELGTLSCNQFKDSLQNWPISTNKRIHLPAVRVLPPSRTRRRPLQDNIVDTTGPMNISISYSRHTPLTPLPIKPNALANLSVLTHSTRPTPDPEHMSSLPGAHGTPQGHMPSLPGAHGTPQGHMPSLPGAHGTPQGHMPSLPGAHGTPQGHMPSLPGAHGSTPQGHMPSLPGPPQGGIPSLPGIPQGKKQADSAWSHHHPSLIALQEAKMKPLLNSATVLKGQGLAINHKNFKQQKLEPINVNQLS